MDKQDILFVAFLTLIMSLMIGAMSGCALEADVSGVVQHEHSGEIRVTFCEHGDDECLEDVAEAISAVCGAGGKGK